jgi:hypothetical protein
MNPSKPVAQPDPHEAAARGVMYRYHNTESRISAFAALLREREALAEASGREWMLSRIRSSLVGYPDQGGDIEVMKEVDRLRAAAERSGAEAMRAKYCHVYGNRVRPLPLPGDK